MRTIRTLTLITVAFAVVFLGPTTKVRAQVAVDVNLTVFHSGLAGYGDWVASARFGNVWVPRHAAAWRPYSVGYWTYTDVGWTWVSDEPWAWATYHYGRWAFDPVYGWIWVPDTTWGPAWVAWRSNDEYMGWAPLPPGVAITEAFDPPIESFAFVFVPTRYVFEPHLAAYIVPQARNVTYIGLTANQTHFSMSGGVVFNSGVRVDAVEHVIGHAVPRYTIQASTAVGPARVSAGRVAIYRPTTVVIDHPVQEPMRPGRVETVDQMNARHTQESRDLASAQVRERASLERQHNAELAHPPSGMTHTQLVARQEQEHQAQAQNEARQKQQMDARHAEEQRGHGRGGK